MDQFWKDREAEATDANELSESDRHRLLVSPQRRTALAVLADRSGPVDVDELATAIATRTSETDAAPRRVVERVRTGLHHCHLPKMADLGVVDYDPESKRIEPRDGSAKRRF